MLLQAEELSIWFSLYYIDDLWLEIDNRKRKESNTKARQQKRNRISDNTERPSIAHSLLTVYSFERSSVYQKNQGTW